jgi:hemerythrin superfamily protein
MKMESFEVVDDNRIQRLEKEHAFLLALLVDIERAIDRGDIDLQQTAVAIKRLRDILGTTMIMKDGIKPGLVRT